MTLISVSASIGIKGVAASVNMFLPLAVFASQPCTWQWMGHAVQYIISGGVYT